MVVPAEFNQDGTDASLNGVVFDGTTYWQYIFEFHGLTSNGTGYYQDLGVGCSLPDMSNWSFYTEFNGTLTNLISNESYELQPRDGPHNPQIGTSASLLDTGYGISFWFQIPETTVIGDINLALKCVL